QASTKPLAIGFYVNWDDSSYQSLKRGLGSLDWVVPEWIRLQTGDNPVVGEIDPRALDLIRQAKPNTPIIPMIHNSREGKWDVPALTQAVGDDMKRRQVIQALASFVESNRFQGVCVDFEEVPAAAQPNLLRFMRELRGAFQPRGWVVTQTAPFDNSDWDYRAYAAANDYLMLMAYDEHWADSAPGSVAGEPWFEETLARRMSEIAGDRVIVCVGGYGYDWSPGRETAEMTFQEAVLAARDSEAEINFDPVTRNPYFRYREEDNSQHTVWFLDAVTAFNQMRAALKYQPAGFALWRLGSEDPSLWSVFGTDRMNADGLGEIKYGYDVDFEGAG
ncbi:MAG TPA: glycosyl hydrolase family 18 protein, partial [Blastocatellia bacterium]|nr:glycosyl hydrolase family 18 protein [Blastocatellia bacterium]